MTQKHTPPRRPAQPDVGKRFKGNTKPPSSVAMDEAVRNSPYLTQRDIDLMTQVTNYEIEAQKTAKSFAEQIASGKFKFGLSTSTVVETPSGNKVIIGQFIETKGKEDEGLLNSILFSYLKSMGVAQNLWNETAAEIERVIRKQLAKSEDRPLWNDRANYPELTHLPAPEFLKRIWADAIGPDGAIEKDTVRQRDPALMGTVEAYIANRQRRNLDAGLATGLKFITRRSALKSASLG